MGLRAGIRLQPPPPPVTATLGASLQRAAHPQRPRQPPAATPRSGGHRAQHLAPMTGHKEERLPSTTQPTAPVPLSGPRQPARRRAPYAPSTRRRTSSILLIDSHLPN